MFSQAAVAALHAAEVRLSKIECVRETMASEELAEAIKEKRAANSSLEQVDQCLDEWLREEGRVRLMSSVQQ